MADLHPFAVHFPIALIFAAAALQIVAVIRPPWMSPSASLWLLGLAVASSFAAMLSGQEAARVAIELLDLSDELTSAVRLHERFATVTVWGSLAGFFALLWLTFRFPGERRVRVLGLAILLLLSLSVGVAGYLGGNLVMKHGVGVGL